ncbi:MAG: hypothetical protein HY286_05390 [Planctomycetes bacterium]|nr:hypothetical protein [Planctomycetota bacterium]
MKNGFKQAALGVAILLASVGCRGASYESDGDEYFRECNFSGAFESYKMAEASGRRGNPTLEAKLKEASVYADLDRGRQLGFQGEYQKSYDLLEQLAARAPENPRVSEWLTKATRSLSRKFTEDGKERMGVREYDQAIQLLEKALRYNPKNQDAIDTLERAKTILKWRTEKGELMWHGGLRAISESQPEMAESKLTAVPNFTDAHNDVDDYISEVRAVVGDNHYRMATGLEKKGQWFAALVEYKKARTLHATPTGIDAAVARMEVEVKADQYYHAGKNSLARDEFEHARDRLTKALDATKNKDNRIAIEAALAQVTEKQNAKEHKDAVNLELEGRLAEAIDALRILDTRSPAYGDTRERIDRLTRQLRDAQGNYKDALAKLDTGDLLGGRAKLKAALFLQPFMPEARAKLKEVDAALAAQKKDSK